MRGANPSEHTTGRFRQVIAATPPAAGLLIALLAVGCFAAWADGAIAAGPAAITQSCIALCGLGAVLAVCCAKVTIPRSGPAWTGVGLLTLLALWSAVSIAWSVLPDASWLAANRVIGYAVVCAVALLAASSVHEPARWIATGIGAVATAVAVWALAGKIAPGLAIGPFDLDPGGRFARLSEPLGYWNALGLVCVMGSIVSLWAASSAEASSRERSFAVAALAVTLLATCLTYSRGALLVGAGSVVVLIAAGPRRPIRLALMAAVSVSIGPAVLLAFTLGDLSDTDVSLPDRIGGGLLLGAMLAVCVLVAIYFARQISRHEEWLLSHPLRIPGRRLVIALVTAALLAFSALIVTSERGPGSTVSAGFEQFSAPESTPANEPSRLVSASGSDRWVWWQEAGAAWLDRPLDGWGAGSFPTLHYLYRTTESPVRSAHSLPLSLAAESGIVGLILGLGGIGLLLFAAIRELGPADDSDASARLVLIVIAGAWLFHSLFDWHWEIPGVTIFALVALAVAAAPARPSVRRPRVPGARRAIVASVAAALATAALVVSAALPVVAENRRVKALELAAAGGPASLEDAAREGLLAHRLNPLSVEPLLTSADIAAAAGDTRQRLEWLTEAAELQPRNWRVDRDLAFTAVGEGDRDATLRYVTSWARDDPFSFDQSRDELAARLFSFAYPAAGSPTAFGTPPQR